MQPVRSLGTMMMRLVVKAARSVTTVMGRLGLAVSGALAVLLWTGCSEPGYSPSAPSTATGPSAAFGIWVPGPNDDCTAAIHDQYQVIGPDGKLYPTWHPPVDPATGCHFGHEHGRDPRGSNLYNQTGPIPFGLANEALDAYDPGNPRHEDHFGHKIEWENDIPLHLDGLAGSLLSITCDVLVKLHQGTHSKDAFTNNLHELVYHMRCNDGTELHITILAAIGTPGQFDRTCDDSTIVVGPAVPANSPNGGGRRIIPDRVCADQFILVPQGLRSDFNQGLHESWQTSNGISAEGGHGLAFFNPYFQVVLPSRFYDPSLANLTGRPIDLCFQTEPNGDHASGGACDESTQNGVLTSLPFDDPRSAFNGALRFVDINTTRISNKDGPTTWYTDPFGHHGRTAPFLGSIRQFISKIDQTDIFDANGPTIGRNRVYSGVGTHSPN